MLPSNNISRNDRGFSLTELLVAVAITVIIMGGILGVLTSVMRATSRGHAVQQAYELARGTYESIETDLASAYVSRDTGDDFKFFGCPFGFMFIAALDPGDPDSLSRVSYFIHAESINGEVEFYDQDTGEYIPQGTVSLVRYVEPGVTDLDVFPVDWIGSVTDPSIEPGPFQDEWQNLADELDGTQVALSDNLTSALDILERLGEVRDIDTIRNDIPAEHDLMLRAKLRELWLRMLAGDPNVPSYFINDDPNHAVLTDLDWRDYVIAERMPYQTRDGRAVVQADGTYVINRSMIDFANPDQVTPQYFSYGTRYNTVQTVQDLDGDGDITEIEEELASQSVDMFTTFWGSVYNVHRANVIYVPKNNVRPHQTIYAIGSPLDPALPELIGVNTGVELGSPFVGVPEFDEDFVQIIDVPAGYQRKQTRPFDELFYTIGS